MLYFGIIVRDYNYSIDILDDISHIFFGNGEKYIASLETVDYENYLFIEEPVAHEGKLLLNQTLIQENIQNCYNGKADIDELLQGESWKPLGHLSTIFCAKWQNFCVEKIPMPMLV